MARLRIRIASEEWASREFEAIQKFYQERWHNGNVIRDPRVLMQSILDNKAYLLENADNDELLGVSFCFSLGNGEYTESGGTRIEYSGYRLQRVVNIVKVMHEFMRDPPRREYYTIIADWNRRSFENMMAIGFEKWVPDDELISLIGSTPKEGKTFYRLPKEALSSVRDRLLDIVEVGTLSGKPPLPSVSIEFDIGIIRDGRLTRDTEF